MVRGQLRNHDQGGPRSHVLPRAVPDIAKPVFPPAVGDVRCCLGAGVHQARGHLRERESAGDRHGGEAIGHRAITELTGPIASPAVGLAVGRLAASMHVTDGHAPERESACDCSRPEAGDDGLADPELAIKAQAPAERSVRRRHGACVLRSGVHLTEQACPRSYASRSRPIYVGAVPEAPAAIGPPAVRSARRGNAARVCAACFHLLEGESTYHRDRRQSWTVRNGAGPELVRTAGVYVRAESEDLSILDGNDDRQRAELIAERLKRWKALASA